jgi:O-antigen/teichoic acid export membrane protein
MVPLYTYTLTTSQFGTVDLLITTVNLFLPIASLSLFDAVFRFAMDNDVDNAQVFNFGSTN